MRRKRWSVELEIVASEQEMVDMLTDLRARFVDRVRSRTTEAWLREQELAPAEPFLSKRSVVYSGPTSRRQPR